MIIDKLKNEIKNAMKAKDNVRRDILRLLVSDTEAMAVRQKKEATDDLTINTAKKIIAGIDETLKVSKDADRSKKLEEEKKILEEYMPKMWSLHEIESFIYWQSNKKGNDLFERITKAPNDGAAMGIAMKALKKGSANVDGKDVKKIVSQIREEN